MSRNKQKHKQEKKRRHERQINEGTRAPEPEHRERIRRVITTQRKKVKLSQLDSEVVKQVLDLVASIEL